VSAPAAPEPTWWAHDRACAWTAAWVTVMLRSRDWQGPREVLADPELKGKVVWSTRVKLRSTGHRPDLTVRGARGVIPIEVELQRKDTSRTEGILVMYRGWITEGKIRGVAYVCGNDAIADRIGDLARRVGIPDEARRIDLLDDVRQQALQRTGEPEPVQAASVAPER
jgi:hypothetical protein